MFEKVFPRRDNTVSLVMFSQALGVRVTGTICVGKYVANSFGVLSLRRKQLKSSITSDTMYNTCANNETSCKKKSKLYKCVFTGPCLD